LRKSFRYSSAVTARQARDIDQITIHRHGIPGIILMEQAGRAVAEEVLPVIKKLKSARLRPRTAIFCGKGNNGGDGLVCARYLLSIGVDVRIYMLCVKNELKGDAFYNMLALNKRKVDIFEITGAQQFNRLKKSFRADIIVDAIFGTGFRGRPGRVYENVIRLINSSAAYKIAIDVPSGLDATTGITEGAAVIADLTVTMGFPKTGFYRNSGPCCCGKIKAADIGLRG